MRMKRSDALSNVSIKLQVQPELQRRNFRGFRLTTPMSIDELQAIVRENDKQRFTIKDDRIRANQGHSIDIALQLEPREPPDLLYHGTVTRYLDSIQTLGLQKMQRQYVHLSRDAHTARKVGARHGKPAILRVQAGMMARAGYLFYRSENGVWLTEAVPALYLEPMEVT